MCDQDCQNVLEGQPYPFFFQRKDIVFNRAIIIVVISVVFSTISIFLSLSLSLSLSLRHTHTHTCTLFVPTIYCTWQVLETTSTELT